LFPPSLSIDRLRLSYPQDYSRLLFRPCDSNRPLFSNFPSPPPRLPQHLLSSRSLPPFLVFPSCSAKPHPFFYFHYGPEIFQITTALNHLNIRSQTSFLTFGLSNTSPHHAVAIATSHPSICFSFIPPRLQLEPNAGFCRLPFASRRCFFA